VHLRYLGGDTGREREASKKPPPPRQGALQNEDQGGNLHGGKGTEELGGRGGRTSSAVWETVPFLGSKKGNVLSVMRDKWGENWPGDGKKVDPDFLKKERPSET